MRLRALAIVSVAALLALAAPTTLAADSVASAEAQNQAPTVTSVTLYTSDPSASVTGTSCPAGTTSAAPVPAATRTIYLCALVEDGNGWQDVCATDSTYDTQLFTAYAPDGITALAANHDRSDVQLTCGSGSGTTVTLTGSFVMEYWRPTAATVADVSTGYLVTVSVKDVANATASGSQRFHYSAIKSIGSVAALDFGQLAPGANATRSATIVNQGNAAFALDVTGAAFTTARGSVAASQIAYGPNSSAAAGALSTTAVQTIASIAAATSDSGSSDTLYLRLNMPAGSSQYVPAGAYSATLRFTAS